MLLQAAVELAGNPDEVVYVSPQSVYDAIPPEQQDWKEMFYRVIGTSLAGEYKKKGEIFDYALNAWAQRNLPQFWYQTSTFYNASHMFLIDSDLRVKDPTFDPNFKAFWEVRASVHWFQETHSDVDPCIDHYSLYPGVNYYFGRTPYVEENPPVLVPCFPDRKHYRIYEHGKNGPWDGGWSFNYRLPDGTQSPFVAGGGITIEGTFLEVSEGGLIFVSLPALPDGAPYPPPLVGRVIDYGPPGERGPQGLPGPPGADGAPFEPELLVPTVCALSPQKKEEFIACLGIPMQLSYIDLIIAAAPVDIKQAQQIILETAPEVLLPQTEVVLTEEGAAALEAIPTLGLGWKLLLTLPLAALLLMKMEKSRIRYSDCGIDGTPEIKEIDFPVQAFDGTNQLALFQAIFDQFWILQQCCKPCATEGWDYIGTFEGPYENYHLKDYDAIRLQFVGLPGPEINTWYRTGTIFKLGELRWALEDGADFHLLGFAPRLMELQFWNSYNQVFEAPNGLTIGFKLDMEYIKPYEVWARVKTIPPGQTPQQLPP